MAAVERRVSAWLEVVGDLLNRPLATYPRQVVADRLAADFDTEVSWNWLDPDGRMGFDVHRPIPGWPPPWVLDSLPRLVALHPLVQWFSVSGDPTPMSTGRVPRRAVAEQGFPMLLEVMGPFGMEVQLSIPYQLGVDQYRAFVLARADEEFSAEDLAVSQRVQTLLVLLDRQTTVLATRRGSSTRPGPVGLTGRELAVLQLLSEGLTATAIAHRLAISPRTVHRHLQNLYRKLGVCDRLRAVLAAQECGLLTAAWPAASRVAARLPAVLTAEAGRRAGAAAASRPGAVPTASRASPLG